jgi:hypothetical protein
MQTITIEDTVARRFRLAKAPTLVVQPEGVPPMAFTWLHDEGPFRGRTMAVPAPSTYSAAVSWIHVTGPDALRLYRNGNAADFRPDAECLRPGGSVLGGSDVIAAEMKQAVDLIVG